MFHAACFIKKLSTKFLDETEWLDYPTLHILNIE